MSNSSSQDFLFRHFEKFILGVLVCLALFLIYRGFQMPNFLDEHQPDRMEQGANQVKTAIDEDHWENINNTESRLQTIDVVARTNESIRPVASQLYRLNHPWEGKSIDASLKRTDPTIASPIELLVNGVIASIAVKSPPGRDPMKESEYPLKALESAAPIVVKAPEPKKPPRRPRRSMDEGMMDDYMMEGSGMEGMEEMPGMEGMMGMGNPGGMAGVGMKPARQIDAKKYDQGFRPMQAGKFEPAIGHFISGVALMPHKELFKAYQESFQQADGYNPLRDQPVYIGYSLQRADVTDKPVDQLVDGDWVTRFTSKNIQQLLLNYWAGMAKEIVAGKYRDPELTSAIPPILLKNYTDFVSHPKIPLGDEDLTRKNPSLMETAPVGPIMPTVGDDPFSGANIGTAQPGAGMMDAGMMGAGYEMEGGYGMGMEGAGSGMDGGYGMGGYGMGGGYGTNVPNIASQPDHKLIRFYDFRDFTEVDKTAPVPGRKYVYRIRVALEDPNFPRNPSLQPRNSTLSAEVFRRVEQETAKANTGRKRNSIRWSEFSAPSPEVSLPPMSGMYAGPVVPAQTRKMQLDGREIEVTQKPPTGKLVVTQWDTKTYKVPVPIVMNVVRGTILAKKGDAEVPDPYAMVVKKLPAADINTQAVVLDLDGGQQLAISQDETQTEPGVMLLFSPDGGLQVSDEISSQHNFQFFSSPE